MRVASCTLDAGEQDDVCAQLPALARAELDLEVDLAVARHAALGEPDQRAGPELVAGDRERVAVLAVVVAPLGRQRGDRAREGEVALAELARLDLE